MTASLSEFGSGLLTASAQIEGAQTTTDRAMEDMSEALRALGDLGTGSVNGLISDTLTDVALAITSLESVLAAQVRCTERLRTYLASQGL